MVLLRVIFFFSFLLSVDVSFAQLGFSISPNLSGTVLLDELVEKYKPQSVLSYGQARDTLFSLIESEDDILTCVYTGHSVYINPELDPTTAAFKDNSPDGINTEHTWPRSFGASSGNPKSDMHHLYPTRSAVNSARQNKPYGDIEDFATDSWFYLENVQTEIPFQDNIKYFSESSSDLFEPREDHKGNVARAMFYFYTMYKAEADQADPDFFDDQKETLCKWHIDDPVDQREWDRNTMIAKYQDDKLNPFILDCTLAERSYCSDYEFYCDTPLSTENELFADNSVLFVSPSLVIDHTKISFHTRKKVLVDLFLVDMTGNLVHSIYKGSIGQGEHKYDLDESAITNLYPGVYNCILRIQDDISVSNISTRIIKS